MQPVLESTEEATEQSSLPLRRILVVDDEEPIVRLLQESLTYIPNCEVLAATSGVKALQLCREHKIDLLLTDYSMPEFDGLSLARKVRQFSSQTLIVMLTAHKSETLSKKAASLGISGILAKPVKLAHLRIVIGAILDETTLEKPE